jgi:hypothetical protein
LPGSGAALAISVAVVCASVGACALPTDGLALDDGMGTPEAGATRDAWASGSDSQPPGADGGGGAVEGGAVVDGQLPDAAAGADGTGDDGEAGEPDEGGDAAGGGDDASADDGAAGDAASDCDASAADVLAGDALAADGSGPPDGTESDASDAGPIIAPGGPSLCANAGFLFCDGFEGTLSAWVDDSSGGQATIDTTRAFRGTHALHARTDGVNNNSRPFQRGYVDHVQTWPETLFARAFLYVPSPYLAQSAAGVLVVFQPMLPYAGAEIDLLPNTRHLAFNGFVDPTLSGGIESSTALTLDTWHCLEMEIDGVGKTFHAYLDDVELVDLAHALAGTPPTLSDFQVGLGFYQSSRQPQADLWVDEVAVNGSRIGCR